MISKLGADVLPLKVFIRKGQVVTVYRAMLRSIRYIDDNFVQVDLRRQVTTGFRSNMYLKDAGLIAQAIKEAHGHLKMLNDMGRRSSLAADSWINQSTPDDERGRVGTGWPWEGS